MLVGIVRVFSYLKWLHHVRVIADDVVYPLLYEPVALLLYPLWRQAHILVAPVHAGDYGIGRFLFCCLDVACNDFLINEVYDYGVGYLPAVCAVGVVQY